MARNKSRIAAFARFKELYFSQEQMPWDKIQTSCGIQFSQEARNEIFACTAEFPAAVSLQAQGAEVKLFEDLLSRLDSVATEVIKLGEYVSDEVHPYDETDEQKAVQQAFGAINFAFNDDVSIRKEIQTMVNSASSIKSCLSNDPALDLTPTALEPRTVGLAAFISALLKGAEAKPARGSHVWGGSSYEFSHWGLSIGPQSIQFQKFLSQVLQQELPTSSVKRSWEIMRSRINSEHPHFSTLRKEM